MANLLGAIITGVFSLVGVIVTVLASNRAIGHKMGISQAVTETKIDELTREVREHNNFARRMPVLEEKMRVLETKFDMLERRS